MTDESVDQVDLSVFATSYNELLREWEHRDRLLGQQEASHPLTLQRVMSDLDAIGQSKAGDCIQSLVLQLQLEWDRAQEVSFAYAKLTRHIPPR